MRKIKRILKIKSSKKESKNILKTLRLLEKHIDGIKLNPKEKPEMVLGSKALENHEGIIMQVLTENRDVFEVDLTAENKKAIKQLKKVLEKEEIDYELVKNE